MAKPFESVRILGVDFYNDRLERALQIARMDGGLFLAPSGPGLAELGQNPYYDRALKEADINLIDSGYLTLLWKKRTGKDLARHSGLKFIKALIQDPHFQGNPKQLWVVPGPEHAEATSRYLRDTGVTIDKTSFYEAPHYSQGLVTDEALLRKIRAEKPDYIVLAIAGGKQEVLGHWLREHLEYKPAIICIGAAIAFLSGQQARIPDWADRIFVGWLLRILQDPKTFLPRYLSAFKLRKLLARYGTSFPEADRQPLKS